MSASRKTAAILISFVVVACVACGSDSAKKPSVAMDAAGQTGNQDAARPTDAARPDARPTDADMQDAPDQDASPLPPEVDFDAIQDQACQMAGGTCVPQGECGARNDGAYLSGLGCRNSNSGLTCCRKPADCPSFDTTACCRLIDGKLVGAGGAGCDRGYLSCDDRPEAWISSTLNCKDPSSMKIEPTPESAPSRWPDAVSTAEAGRWACAQAGGVSLPFGSSGCGDGYGVGLGGPGPCCVPKSACPEVKTGTECCSRTGRVESKGCFNGRAMCQPALIALGTLQEVKAGTCAPFEP